MHLDRDLCYRALLTRDARFDGRFFIAVRTTGIYCRPICPATPPKPENVIFMPSAAAAQAAGFRPCLRCRPETSPELGAWHGTWNTVSRAMALIAGGALNQGDVETLAERLGVGGRQLRRLFRQHLGASPKAIAAARRVNFAKRLIGETSLPMAEIALAAGFGSVRRFNDTFLHLFGRGPGSFRRAKTASAIGTAITLNLPFKRPYDWPAMIGFLAARAIPGVESVRPDRYARTITLDGATGTIAVSPSAQTNALTATINFPAITALPVIVERIRRIFDLGADPVLIGAHLSEDALMAPRVAAHPGLRVPGAWDGFELAVRAILGQQITVTAATKLAGKLVAAFGAPLPPPTDHPDRANLRFAFPPPERLAGVDLATSLRMPRARAAALAALAEAALRNPALFEPGRSLDDAIATLQILPGIGAWTAHYIAMRALREPDAFPESDIGLRRALATRSGRPTAAELLARAEAWRPWRAYAALHLWASAAASPPETRHEPPARPHRLPARDNPARL